MVLTKDYLEQQFKRFNIEYFKNSLPIPKIEINHLKTHLGEFQACKRLDIFANPIAADVIRISEYFEREEKMVQETLIHEMIHYYISYNGIEDTGDHGKEWKRLAAEINTKGGWSITRTTSVAGCPRNPKYIRTKTKKIAKEA